MSSIPASPSDSGEQLSAYDIGQEVYFFHNSKHFLPAHVFFIRWVANDDR
jgi:hypothetical protein